MRDLNRNDCAGEDQQNLADQPTDMVMERIKWVSEEQWESGRRSEWARRVDDGNPYTSDLNETCIVQNGLYGLLYT
jgi:hypothetical protein